MRAAAAADATRGDEEAVATEDKTLLRESKLGRKTKVRSTGTATNPPVSFQRKWNSVGNIMRNDYSVSLCFFPFKGFCFLQSYDSRSVRNVFCLAKASSLQGGCKILSSCKIPPLLPTNSASHSLCNWLLSPRIQLLSGWEDGKKKTAGGSECLPLEIDGGYPAMGDGLFWSSLKLFMGCFSFLCFPSEFVRPSEIKEMYNTFIKHSLLLLWNSVCRLKRKEKKVFICGELENSYSDKPLKAKHHFILKPIKYSSMDQWFNF